MSEEARAHRRGELLLAALVGERARVLAEEGGGGRGASLGGVGGAAELKEGERRREEEEVEGEVREERQRRNDDDRLLRALCNPSVSRREFNPLFSFFLPVSSRALRLTSRYPYYLGEKGSGTTGVQQRGQSLCCLEFAN